MDLAWTDRDVAQTVALLGGDAAFDRQIGTVIDAHEALADGFPSEILQNLLSHCSFLEQGDALQKAVVCFPQDSSSCIHIFSQCPQLPHAPLPSCKALICIYVAASLIFHSSHVIALELTIHAPQLS